MLKTRPDDLGHEASLPGIDEIRAQLERILSSPEFPGTGRAAAFLRYVVEETLAGRASRIKGYSIAIEVFGRDENFTQDDPVVRIEAGRLRRSLERYYLVEGDRDMVRIEIPKGGYTPSFSWRAMAAAERVGPQLPPLVASADTKFRWWYGPVLGGATMMTLAAVMYWVVSNDPNGTANQQAKGIDGSQITAELTGNLDGPGTRVLPNSIRLPAVYVIPFSNIDGSADAKLYSVALTEELLTALPRFNEIKVFGRETSTISPAEIDAFQISKDLGARFLLTGGVRASSSRLRVTVRLVSPASGEIFWSEDYDENLALGDPLAIQKDVARRVAATIAQPYGVLAQVDREISAAPGSYDCAWQFYAYRAQPSVEAHAATRQCLETTVAEYPAYATAWAMLSITYLDEGRFKLEPKIGSPQPTQRALIAARNAIQLDPNDTRGLQALMMALFVEREVSESMRVGEQALATNPNDTELIGEFGTGMALSGRWGRGATLLDQAIALHPAGGGYYHGMRALAAYMLDDIETAVSEIRKTDMTKFPFFHAVAAVTYAQAGLDEEGRRHAQIFAQMQPDFVANIEAELEARNIQPDDRRRLMAGLRKAGLPLLQEAAVALDTSNLPPR